MKKIVALSMLFSMFLFSCKSSQPSVTSTKLDKSSQVAIKGNWQITSVTYPGSDYIKVNSFDVADSKCFVGSTWSFISNNNKGTMALTNGSCTAFSSPIVWSINNEGLFVLKILDAGIKSSKVRDGYILRVANQTQDSFQLIDKMNVGGQMKDITYQFKRS